MVCFAFACSSARKQSAVGNTSIVVPVNYGNGVYYFPVTEAAFGNSLSEFIAQHQTLEVMAMTGDGTKSYGWDKGYFVVFKTLPMVEN